VKRRPPASPQDRQIALDEAVGDTGRGGGHAGPARQARLQARKLAFTAVKTLLCR